jgi:hypothetical protein
MKRNVRAWKQRVVYCKDVLKQKLTAHREAEREQCRLRRTVEERDTKLAKVQEELEAERRARTDAERLRGQLTKA